MFDSGSAAELNTGAGPCDTHDCVVLNEVAVSAVAASGIIHNAKVGFPKGDWEYEISPSLTDEVSTVDEDVQDI